MSCQLEIYYYYYCGNNLGDLGMDHCLPLFFSLRRDLFSLDDADSCVINWWVQNTQFSGELPQRDGQPDCQVMSAPNS